MEKEFWKKKKLSEFSEKEWEAVCMRCGVCCLHKKIERGIAYFSNQLCDGFDLKTGKCSRYKNRLCASCVKVDMHLLQTERELLPETCAYRLLYEGKALPDYHPLVSGDFRSVHKARKTVREMPQVYSERDLMIALRRTSMLSVEDARCLLERYQVYYFKRYLVPPKN